MSHQQTENIAIIGGGLSGLCLALALQQQQIPCVIYESRPQPLDVGGAIMLSPNALRILDRLGVYSRLLPLAYNFQNLYFRTDDDQIHDTFEFGSVEKHGYDGMRIYRFELIKVLLEKLAEVGIVPVYGKKFSHVVSETAETGVTWAFADGSSGSASLLVGADGIHSRVRTHIDPAAVPVFTKMVAVTAAVPTAQLQLEEQGLKDYPLPVTLMNKKHGAFVIAPQRRDGSELLIGKQCHFSEDLDKDGWDKMFNDKEWCVDFLRKNAEDYPSLVARAVSNIPVQGINLWPFYVVPKLASWTSSAGKVIVLGDAAHAIPPTAGQGVNQAFEDVFVFAQVAAKSLKGDNSAIPSGALKAWQAKRQARVDRVLELNAKINKRRMPAVEGESQEPDTESFDMRWLYDVDFDAMVDEIVAGTV